MADEIKSADVSETPTTREKTVELTYPNWLRKITERVTLFFDCLDHKRDDVNEDDWEILEMLHRDWYEGSHPLYQTIQIPLAVKVTEQSLFDAKTAKHEESSVEISVTPDNFDDARDKMIDGKEIADIPTKPKKKRK